MLNFMALYWPQGLRKEDTIQFGKPICKPWAQCSSIYWPCPDIVFRFIVEYSSLRDFCRPLGNNNRSIYFYMRIYERWYFGLCWNLRLILELWYLEGFMILLEDFFWRLYIFCMVKYWNFHNSSFALRFF
jgi:hypothetical protein